MQSALVKYQYGYNNHPFIYYKINRYLSKDNTILHQFSTFNYSGHNSEGDKFEHLPAGCPPPEIPQPTKPNPCNMGYKVGQVISTTVA